MLSITVSMIFLSTPSARRATADFCGLGSADVFLSTPSARRATYFSGAKDEHLRYFYPRPPRGGRLSNMAKILRILLFLSTPSARRATHLNVVCCCFFPISIHALREEGDEKAWRIKKYRQDFYPRPPRGGRLTLHHNIKTPGTFLSTPSARRATTVSQDSSITTENFYPRPPRGGRQIALCDAVFAFCISIHALREEGDASSTRCS